MTKISQYSIDQNISGSDKWIGSDSQMQNATKNFTPDKLAKYFNDNQVIDTGAEVRFKYVVLNVGEQRPFGSVTFVPQQGNTVAFSGITSFILSKRNTAGNLVPDFIEFLDDKKILISKTRDINTFGYYNVVSVEEYEPEPDFYEVTLEFIGGNGGLTKDIDFIFEFISNATLLDYDFEAPLELNGTTVSISQSTSTTDGYLSADDWNTFNDKQNTVTLTTTGSSGPATLIEDVLNIPEYQSVLTNPITGTGTISYVPRFTGTTTIGDGSIFDDGTKIGIGTTTLTEKVNIVGKIDIVYGSDNVFIGRNSGLSSTGGSGNTAIGWWSLKNITSGNDNTVVGTSSGLFSSGTNNTIVGRGVLGFSGTSNSNTAVGHQALFNALGCSFNTAIGTNALGNITTGTYNIGIGDQSGRLLTTGTNSVYLGNFTTASSGSVTNEIVIGSNNAGIGSNTVVLGNSSIVTTVLRGNVGIGTTSPTQKLDVTGNINVSATATATTLVATGSAAIGLTTNNNGARILINGSNVSRNFQVANNWNVGGAFEITPSTTVGGSTFTTPALVINGTNSNVGIGTNGPNEKLEISSANVKLRFTNTSVGGQNFSIGTSILGVSNEGFSVRDLTNNVDRIVIGSTGNVGIGTSSPQVDLDVASKDAAGTVARIRLTNKDLSVIDEQDLSEIQFYNSDADGAHVSAYIKNIAAETFGRKGQLAFGVSTTNSTNAVEALRIDENANIGIGTTSPTNKLTVLNATNDYAAQFGGGTATPAWVGIGTVNSGAAPFIQGLSNSLGTTVDLTLQPSGGDVGIGTTNPIGKLDVVGTAAGATLLGGRFSNITANATGVKTRIELPVFNGSSGGVIEEIGNSIDGYRLNIYQSQSAGVLTFGTAGDNERMRITSTGNVGIGTSAPSIKLQVETSVNGSDGLWVRNTNTGTSAFGSINCVSGVGAINLRAHSAAHSIWANTSMINSASAFTGGMALFQDGANPISLWTNGSERMRVTSAGNVGIGTNSPSSSAVLDLTSTTQGFLPPRMTTTQRTSLGITAAPGLIVYDTTDNKHYGWNGSSWNAFY